MNPKTLLEHADSGQPWPAEAPPLADLAAAYQTQLAVRALRVARGEQPRGYKIGFTNRTIWDRYQVFAPIWGPVWDSTLTLADDAADPELPLPLSLAHTCQPRIEPELVFGFHATPKASDPQALFDAIDWVATGFEIVQSHRPHWKFSAADTVADGALHARLLVGQRLPVATLAADAPSLHRLLAGASVVLQQDARAVDEGRGAYVLDSPLAALSSFVAELRACPGAPDIAAGDVVTTGTWTDAWPVAPGECWTARFTSPLPPVSVRFSSS
jgi:2-oxo-3-hexenedioate decarboxylase